MRMLVEYNVSEVAIKEELTKLARKTSAFCDYLFKGHFDLQPGLYISKYERDLLQQVRKVSEEEL